MACDICQKSGICKDKTGLPILLTRYEIATMLGSEGKHFEKGAAFRDKHLDISNSKAPKLSGNFKVDSGIDLGDCTHYTLRPLRGGYIYLYDEAREKWEAHFVTDNAFLEPLNRLYRNVSDETALLVPGKVPCKPENLQKAMYITIPDPENASSVWICFSDVEWTKDVFDRHQIDGYRKRHMRRFNVKEWMAKQNEPHAGKITDLEKLVADFAEGVNPGAFLFSPSTQQGKPFPLLAYASKGTFWKNPDPTKPPIPHAEAARDGKEFQRIGAFNNHMPTLMNAAAQLVSASERILPGKGAILALDDPAGIAQALAELMSFRLEAFDQQPSDETKLVASTQILMLKKFVEDKATAKIAETVGRFERWRTAQSEYEKELEEWKERQKPGSGYPSCPPPMSYTAANMVDSSTFINIGRSPNSRNLFQPLSDEELAKLYTASQEAAWKDYMFDKGISRYKEDERKKYQDDFDKRHNSYAEAVIKPMAEAHMEWMKSDMLAEYFICNFSTEVPQQGGQYTEVLSLCIRDTQQYEPCAKLYAKWVGEKAGSERNLILQAFALNQKVTWEDVNKHVSERLALQQRGVKLLEKLERSSNEEIDAGTAKELKDFAVDWGVLFKKSAKRLLENASKAFAAIPSDPPPLNSALGRLRLQLVGAALEHYHQAGIGSDLSVLFELHDKSVNSPATIRGNQRQLMGLTVRSVAAGKQSVLDSSFERGRVQQLIGGKEGVATRVDTSLGYKVESLVAGFIEERGQPVAPRATFKNLLRIILKLPLEMKAVNLPSLTFSLSITNGTEMRVFMDSLHETNTPTMDERKREELFRKFSSKPAMTFYSGSLAFLAGLATLDTYKKMQKPTEWDKKYESGTKFIGAGMLFVSSVADTAVKGLEAMGKLQNFAQGARISKGERLLRAAASSKFGAPAGIVGAVWNGVGMVEEVQKENYLLATAYFATGAVDAISALALIFTRIKIPGPVGWGLMILGFVLSQIIIAIKDSNAKKYLNMCAFGNEPAGWTPDKERMMFEQALG